MSSKEIRVSAIVLAGGRGKRMQSDIPKQYLMLYERPLLYYTLKAFEESCVDEIIVVCAAGEEDYCQKEIIDKYHIRKVSAVTPGGKERYDSVYQGLLAIHNADFVLIHDGARPMVSDDIIQRNIEAVQQYHACVTAVPSKDTIKIGDEEGFIKSTPDRSRVWNIQTPQTFEYTLIRSAYESILAADPTGITDDAMAVERTTDVSVKLVMGAYTNIKVTTPEDLDILKSLMHQENKSQA